MFGPDIVDVTVRNNIFYESDMDIDGAALEVDSDYNLYFGATPYAGDGPHSIEADPAFVDYRRHEAWDFRLGDGSPAIDAGDPALGSTVALPAEFVDIDGTVRPAGMAADMGAYER